MLVQTDPPIHLTYCLNVHPGESWAENLAAIRDYATAVRNQVAFGKPFGLGLRIAHQAACELAASRELRDKARAFFHEQNLYPFTINGFPYGRFHGSRVKEQVYAPDWRTPERREYTNTLASILAEWLPDGMDGSISTVPCSFKPWVRGDSDVGLMAGMLIDCARHLDAIRQRTGKEIHLGLEPEPACWLETTEETVQFFEVLFRAGKEDEGMLRRHIGVCLDTCHVALQFEDTGESLARYQAAGIRISKVQLSTALRARSNSETWRALERFCEPVYLHQVKARRSDGSLLSWTDLPEALRELPESDAGEIRVHFHVPLFFDGDGTLGSTGISPEFLSQLRASGVAHWEIETYTFDVLPPELRAPGLANSINREYPTVLRKLNAEKA